MYRGVKYISPTGQKFVVRDGEWREIIVMSGLTDLNFDGKTIMGSLEFNDCEVIYVTHCDFIMQEGIDIGIKLNRTTDASIVTSNFKSDVGWNEPESAFIWSYTMDGQGLSHGSERYIEAAE